MVRILFVCHGNICRSPMAEFVFNDMVEKKGLLNYFHADSAATSSEEIGNPVYPPVRRILDKHHMDCSGKRARRISSSDYDNYDYIIGMDDENMYNLQRLFPFDKGIKVHPLLSFADRDEEVADPWYTGEFETTWKDINEGCNAFLAFLLRQNSK